MAERKTVTAYVVQRVNWEYNDERYFRCDEGNEPVQVFLDRRKAEAHALELERALGRGNLGHALDLHGTEESDWSTLPQEELVARVRAAGLGPTPEDEAEIRNSYGAYSQAQADADPSWLVMAWLCQAVERESHRWSEAQQRAVWEAFDRLRQYVVIETAVELEE
jgi:hypothetical protein